MKLKDLSELGSAYDLIRSNAKENVIPAAQVTADVLLTDATQYVPTKTGQGSKQVKAGSPLGGGPGADGDEVKVAKDWTGPHKADGFEEVTKLQDPGSDEKVMKVMADHDDDSTNNHPADNGQEIPTAARFTQSKKKVMESAAKDNKYQYQPKFTMSKPKFDQLYEEAINRIPFTENLDDASGAPHAGADAGVPPADDVAADSDSPVGDEEAPADVTVTLTQDEVSCLRSLLSKIDGDSGDDLNDLGDGSTEGDVLGHDDGTHDGADLAAEGKGSTGLPDAKTVAADGDIKIQPDTKAMPKSIERGVKNIRGDLKATGKGVAKNGDIKIQPDTKAMPKAIDAGKDNVRGNLKKGENFFEN